MGIAKQLGHVTDEQALLPTPVCNDAYKGQKVVEFDVGEDTLVLLTDKGQVFWSGVDLAYKPIKWELPADVKI